VTAVGVGVLTTDTDVPVVTETTVNTVTLEALEIVTEGGVDHGRNVLEVLASVTVLLTVEEVSGDVEVLGGLDDSKDGVHLSLSDLTGTLVDVNVSTLDNSVGEATADTLDSSKGVGDLLLTINVGVDHTENVLEVIILDNKSL